VKPAEALHESALVEYEKAIQTAFTEVSNALIAHQRVRESRVQQELLVTALRDRTRLAYVRYRGGVDTLLNALDADHDQFQVGVEPRTDATKRTQLYKTLGGGWQ
jgi:outer membrane protein TolC